MNPIATCAETVLTGHPHPTLRLSELLAAVAERVDRALRPEHLRTVLEEHPDRFRMFDPWQGPWRDVTREESGGVFDAWVVLVTEPTAPLPQCGPTSMALRESVRWLGRSIDARSPMDVSRWYEIVLAERAAREAMARREA